MTNWISFDVVKSTNLAIQVRQINASLRSAVCYESNRWVVFLCRVTEINGMTSDTAVMNLLWNTFVWKSSSNGLKPKWKRKTQVMTHDWHKHRKMSVNGGKNRQYWGALFVILSVELNRICKSILADINGEGFTNTTLDLLRFSFSLLCYLLVKPSNLVHTGYLWQTHLREVLPHDLDKVRHGEVHDVVSPGGLQHHIRPQQVIAGE